MHSDVLLPFNNRPPFFWQDSSIFKWDHLHNEHHSYDGWLLNSMMSFSAVFKVYTDKLVSLVFIHTMEPMELLNTLPLYEYLHLYKHFVNFKVQWSQSIWRVRRNYMCIGYLYWQRFYVCGVWTLTKWSVHYLLYQLS